MTSGKHVIVISEGATEHTFIKRTLAPYLAQRNVYLTAPIIGKPGHKGGSTKFHRAKRDILNFLKQRSDTIITTFFDYYGLDHNWPGRRQAATLLHAVDKAKHLENATLEAICNLTSAVNTKERFIPFFAMHEFEALLFSDPDRLAQMLVVDVRIIQNICISFNNPEEINDDPITAPSKRILQLAPAYRKIVDGNEIIADIGLNHIRGKCPHFNDWLERLEELSPE